MINPADYIDPLHPMILKGYGGVIQGEDSKAIVDIEFRSIHAAAAWAETCEITQAVHLREDTARRSFDMPVVIQFRTLVA